MLNKYPRPPTHTHLNNTMNVSHVVFVMRKVRDMSQCVSHMHECMNCCATPHQSSTPQYDHIGPLWSLQTSSRIIVQGAAVLLLLVGVFGKVNAVFTTIPQPVIGGVIITTFGKSRGILNGYVLHNNSVYLRVMNFSRNLIVSCRNFMQIPPFRETFYSLYYL